MDDWTQQLTTWLNTTGAQAETWLLDRATAAEVTIDAIATAAETAGKDCAQQFEQTFNPWLEPLIQSIWQPLMDTPLDIEVDLDQAIEAMIQPWHQTIVPPLNNHPLCSGCQHYHGQVYGDAMLVCGMYPYGPMADQTSCPDKQPIDWQEPWKTWFQSNSPKP
jgi:hypothetical protein